MDLIDFELNLIKQNKKYYSSPEYYGKIIKNHARKICGKNIRVFLFGSVVKGNFTLSSDIDVLVVIPSIKPRQEAKIITQLKDNFEFASPFHIIICNKSQYENWFRKYILDKYIEIN